MVFESVGALGDGGHGSGQGQVLTDWSMVFTGLDIRNWLSASLHIYSGEILYMTMQFFCLCTHIFGQTPIKSFTSFIHKFQYYYIQGELLQDESLQQGSNAAMC